MPQSNKGIFVVVFVVGGALLILLGIQIRNSTRRNQEMNDELNQASGGRHQRDLNGIGGAMPVYGAPPRGADIPAVPDGFLGWTPPQFEQPHGGQRPGFGGDPFVGGMQELHPGPGMSPHGWVYDPQSGWRPNSFAERMKRMFPWLNSMGRLVLFGILCAVVIGGSVFALWWLVL